MRSFIEMKEKTNNKIKILLTKTQKSSSVEFVLDSLNEKSEGQLLSLEKKSAQLLQKLL